MGYTTYFQGEFGLDRPLTEEHAAYLRKFNNTRRMGRDSDKAVELPDPIREAVELPIGTEGEFFVGAGGFAGQDSDPSVTDYNSPPSTQPGLWCQWTPNEAGTAIVWDDGEKFYYYTEWLQYIITNFLQPWGYTLNGTVEWDGEEPGDIGQIVAENNEVFERQGRIVYE